MFLEHSVGTKLSTMIGRYTWAITTVVFYRQAC